MKTFAFERWCDQLQFPTATRDFLHRLRSEREIALASSELRAQARLSHTKTPIDAKRLADFLAKIEAHETVLLQRQRDIENQLVLYHIEHPNAQGQEADIPRRADQPLCFC
jgi:hypothetical protein